jgi:hypothetical protein
MPMSCHHLVTLSPLILSPSCHRLSPSCHRLVTVLSPSCQSLAIVLSKSCHRLVKVLPSSCHSLVIVLSQSCHSLVTGRSDRSQHRSGHGPAAAAVQRDVGLTAAKSNLTTSVNSPPDDVRRRAPRHRRRRQRAHGAPPSRHGRCAKVVNAVIRLAVKS